MEEKTKKTTATAGVGNAVKIYFKENLGIIVGLLGIMCIFISFSKNKWIIFYKTEYI